MFALIIIRERRRRLPAPAGAKSRCLAEDFRSATDMFALIIIRGREAACPHRQVQNQGV